MVMNSPLALEGARAGDTVRDLRVHSLEGGRLRVCWFVDERKLGTKDKQIISPSIELFPGVWFKIMIKPRPMGERRGQFSFHKAHGKGLVELKCVQGAEVVP